MPTTKINLQNINVIDQLCIPFMFMPVYQTEKGKYWTDDDQITSIGGSVFKPESKHSYLVGFIRFHPLGNAETIFSTY